ncbi:RNA-binding protein [Apis cerana cerana]|uniref:RNA-binding protein n=1 Tax=Apis cerana cerana TaxID=94128 RepID=A0A2A3EH08_APICC|nr:RNA-binding protein [Apis cerana cerana]
MYTKMSRYREWDLSCKVYVGNLGNSASKHEIESAFSKYGPLRNVWVARNPPGFAFVEFEDPRDAEDAVRGLDGTRCCGTRVRVEMSSGRSRRGGGGRRPGPRYSRCLSILSSSQKVQISQSPKEIIGSLSKVRVRKKEIKVKHGDQEHINSLKHTIVLFKKSTQITNMPVFQNFTKNCQSTNYK